MAKEFISLAGGFNLVDLFPKNKFLQATSPVRAKLKKIHIKADQILKNIIHVHKQDDVITKEDADEDHESWKEDLVDVLLRLQQSGSLEVLSRLTT